MNRILIMLNVMLVLLLLSLGFVANSDAARFRATGGLSRFETLDLIGTLVKNPSGEILGFINHFAFDREGRAIFAILWQGVAEDIKAGRYVAVPISALSISRQQAAQVTVVLNLDRKGFDGAPTFDKTKDLNNTEWIASIYQYFGQTPYWTEEPALAAPAKGSPEGGFRY